MGLSEAGSERNFSSKIKAFFRNDTRYTHIFLKSLFPTELFIIFNNKIIIVDVLLEFFRILSFSDNNVEKSKLSLVPSVKICSCNCATLYSFNKSKGLFIIKPPKSKVAISYAYFEA